jgi:hypothetical protein
MEWKEEKDKAGHKEEINRGQDRGKGSKLDRNK